MITWNDQSFQQSFTTGLPPQTLPQDGFVSLVMLQGWTTRRIRSEPYIRRYAGFLKTRGVAQIAHIIPVYRLWKLISRRSTTDSDRRRDTPKIEDGKGSYC